MKELLEIILVFIVFITTVITAVFGMATAKANYAIKGLSSKMSSYRKLFLQTILMYLIGIIVFGTDFPNYTIEVFITFIGIIASSYILYRILRNKGI